MDWFRSWHGAPTDNKWLVIAKRAGVAPMMVSATFWALLDYASQQSERGSIAGFDVETYALWAGVEESDILAVLDAMRAKGVITDGDTLAAWDKRQPKREDDSAERVRRHREKQRNSVTDDSVTRCNADVTQGNAPDKIQSRLDTETDGEGEKKREETTTAAGANGSGLDAQLSAVYSCWADNMPGTMTPIIADAIADDVHTYGADEVIRAVGIAVTANKRSLQYVQGILRRRASGDDAKRNGNGVPPKQKQIGYIRDPRTGEQIEVQL